MRIIYLRYLMSPYNTVHDVSNYVAILIYNNIQLLVYIYYTKDTIQSLRNILSVGRNNRAGEFFAHSNRHL